MIFDWFDNSAYTLVDRSPFLTVANTNAPISPPLGVKKNDLGGGNVLISWIPNPESDLAGYKIHWGNPTGYSFSTNVDVGNVNQYLLTNVSISDSFSVTAYDNSITGYKDLFKGNKERWFSYPADPTSECTAFFTYSQILFHIIIPQLIMLQVQIH